jgi:hypothetical protein
MAVVDPKSPEFGEWLTAMYEQHGERVIAQEMGRSRGYVRRRLRLHGIAKAPRGSRPDGFTAAPVLATASALIAERIYEETSSGRPFGPAIVAARIRGVQDARTAGDELALEDAIISAASALGMWLDHLTGRAPSLASDRAAAAPALGSTRG